MDLMAYIIGKSKELNIDLIGFTDCEPLYRLKDYVLHRQNEGMQTEFEKMDIDKRINPRHSLPQCKSTIVIGLSYYVKSSKKTDYKLKGLFSRSSWGLDYHIVLKNKMEELIRELKKVVDFNYKHYVDTGPLIDRELASKSGIGYYGKNCSIINERYGSFIFLGHVLTDLEIDFPLKTLNSECGDCNICIEHCPTGALQKPFTLDPRKCISYLTQTRNRIPYELRDNMGNKIYGCDTCQIVCPKNKDIDKSNHEEFLPSVANGYVDLEELLFICNEGFRNKYSYMSCGWRGKNILRRNAIIAIGNMKDKNNMRLLEPLLHDPSPMIREYAIWGILNTDFDYGKNLIMKKIDKQKEKSAVTEIENLMTFFANRDYQ